MRTRAELLDSPRRLKGDTPIAPMPSSTKRRLSVNGCANGTCPLYASFYCHYTVFLCVCKVFFRHEENFLAKQGRCACPKRFSPCAPARDHSPRHGKQKITREYLNAQLSSNQPPLARPHTIIFPAMENKKSPASISKRNFQAINRPLRDRARSHSPLWKTQGKFTRDYLKAQLSSNQPKIPLRARTRSHSPLWKTKNHPRVSQRATFKQSTENPLARPHARYRVPRFYHACDQFLI